MSNDSRDAPRLKSRTGLRDPVVERRLRETLHSAVLDEPFPLSVERRAFVAIQTAARSLPPEGEARKIEEGTVPTGGERRSQSERLVRGRAFVSDGEVVWDKLMGGLVMASGTPIQAYGRTFVLLKRTTPSPSRPAPTRVACAVLTRALIGESRKVIAMDLRIATSTAAKWFRVALSRIGVHGVFPLPLVVTAMAWADFRRTGVVRTYACTRDARYLLVSTRSPTASPGVLTPGEAELAALIMDGRTLAEVAAMRLVSVDTLARQQRRVFAKTLTCNRYQLICWAMKQGWFAEAEGPTDLEADLSMERVMLERRPLHETMDEGETGRVHSPFVRVRNGAA